MARIFHKHQLLSSLKINQPYKKLQFRKNKVFINDKVFELGEKTLTGRLLTYLNTFNTQNIKIDQRKPQLNQINLQTTNLNNCDIEQIKTSFKLLDMTQDKNNFYLLQEVDEACYSRVKYLKTLDIFELLHIYMKKVPNRIINYKFYESAMKELSKRLKILNKNEIIQFIFYIGLRKKISKEHEVIRKCINYLVKSNFHSFTAEDLCIICNSTFKTTTRINTEQLFSTIIMYLYNNLDLFKDPAILIALLKTIRQNRLQDDDLLATMTCTIFFNNTLEYYSFAALGHILAVYSDYLYYDENVLKVFTGRCMSILKASEFTSKKEHASTHIRLKDIKRLLWCLSNLNYKLDVADIKTIIVPNILKRVEAGDVEHDYSSLIEITLYLWMLNYRAYELVPYFLTTQNVKYINTLNTPLKQRLNLLLTCIFHEDRQLLKDFNIQPTSVDYNMNIQLEKRPLLQKVITHLDDISTSHELNKFEVSCQVPGIHIIGVTGYKKNTKKVVHVEVLDEYTTLKNVDNMPTGLMQLKLRLLDNLDEALILIESEELKYLNDDEIRKLLLEEIEFVC